MVNYECYRCGYTTFDKSKIKSHLNRKHRCKCTLSNIDIDECYLYILEGLSFDEFSKLERKDSKKSQHLVNKKSTFGQQKVNKKSTFGGKKVNKKSTFSQHLGEKRENIISKKGNFECKYCNKILSYKQSLYIHYKSCKEKLKTEEVNNSMKELINLLNIQLDEKSIRLSEQTKELEKRDKQLENRDKQIDELIKKAGINNINIQNNFKLLSYKDTDLSHLSDNDIKYCLDHSNMCVPHLVKKVHFNPKKPENHNIYISNIKNNYIMIYDGKKWKLKNQNEAIDTLIDDKQLILEQKLEEWIENGKCYPDIMAKFNRYLEKRDNDDVINVIKEDIKLILFNNRKMIKI